MDLDTLYVDNDYNSRGDDSRDDDDNSRGDDSRGDDSLNEWEENGNDLTILHIESKKGNTERVRFILREFAKKNLLTKLTRPKETALHLAIYGNHTEVAELIIDAARQQLPETSSFQAFLRHGDENMNTALHLAVMRRNVAIVKLLVEADPTDTHIQNKYGGTPMFMAVYFGYNDIVEIISTTCTAPSLDGPRGNTALHAAIYNGGIEVVEVLINAARHLLSSASDNDNNDSSPVSSFQAFLRGVNEDSNTALHIAVMQGNLATAQLLVEADPSYKGIKNNQGKTPFYIAVEEGYVDIAKMIICTTCTAAALNLDGLYGRPSALHAVIQNLDEEKNEVRDVIKMYIDVYKCALISKEKNLDEFTIHRFFADEIFSQTDEYGQTILELAVRRNYVEVVELILDIRNPAYRDEWIGDDFISLMPLIYIAMDKEYKSIVELLTQRYEAGAKVSIHGKNQVSLIKAIRRRQKETIFGLLEDQDRAQPLVTFVDKLGWTALHHAAYHEFDSIICAIVEAQKKFEHDFVYQDMVSTPFHVAAERGYTSTVILLMQLWPSSSSAYMNVDKNGQNILHLAALQSNKEMIQGILKHCPERHKNEFVNKQDNRGNTPLHLLMRHGCLVPEFFRYEGLDTRVENKNSRTPLDMLYAEDQIIDDQEDPAYQCGRKIERIGLLHLIYEAIENKYNDDIIKLLCQTYKAGIIDPEHKDVLYLILAMKRRDEDSVLRLLGGAKDLVNFREHNGWTLVHYAVYYEFDSVLGAIIGAQEDVGYEFMYGNMLPTPFHVAVECGYTSTLILLMQLWPAYAYDYLANSPYTVVNEDGQNILHLAATDNSNIKAENRKEMVEGILRYCPKRFKDKMLKQQDNNGDTPLHLLISHGCYIPKLIKDKGLGTMAKNKNNLTPWEMLYLKNDVVADQVHIKIAIDDVQTNQSAWNFLAKSTEKKKDIWKNIPPSKRRIKDVMFDERRKSLMDAKNEQKKKDLERYKMRTNTQIIVTALITTVTFTVGFTLPGGLRQSGEVDEGLAILSKKTAFNAFMISDALALLLSTSSLFFYFLESMNEDPRQVSKLNAASTVLNIVSVMAMMLTFIAGTYLVLSHSPALAFTVCIIGSLFFLLIIILFIKIVYDRLQGKRNLD